MSLPNNYNRLNRYKTSQKGSILIWTVMIGLIMTSIFFFAATRLKRNMAAEQETMIQNAEKEYLESYVNYLMSQPGPPNELNLYDGMKVIISNKVDTINGYIDAGKTSKNYNFSGLITIDWNKCNENFKGDLKIISELEESLLSHNSGETSCPTSSINYDDNGTSITVSAPFTIKSLNAPIFYKISSENSTILRDNKYYLTATLKLPYGKELKINKEYLPISS